MSTQTVQNLVTTSVDLPDLAETFGDAIKVVWFDGNTWRIDVTVTRLDPPVPPQPPNAKQLPSCRLVLSAAAGLDLLNKLSEVAAALEKQGVLKRNHAPSAPVVHH